MSFTLKQLRRLKEISQDAVADSLGVHVQTYRRIEEHPETATIEQAFIIAKCLDVCLADIEFFLPNGSTLSLTEKPKGE